MNAIELQGTGLSGRTSRVAISESERFGLYQHGDSRPPMEITYNIDNVRVDDHSVTVGGAVHVVEHLFSALYGLDLFRVRIDVHGSEVPFFDGSSRHFGRALAGFNSQQSPGISLPCPIEVADGHGSIRYVPDGLDELVIDMSLVHPYTGHQSVSIRLTPETYREEIMEARTFVFTDEDDPRLRDLPPYGIGITCKGIYSSSPLRFPDEPVRHKVLDLLGDLYVLGGGLRGKVVAENTSHRLNSIFIRKLKSAKNGEND
ncbi:UDP-3-O-acyl-N-acetylglucosamine deacetylase [candidate division WOR-3 bacterium]|nr:UDP-3-O-acyl-N-acetylglucosamine deacetylase [candidate division WOR-3 bacterium]